MKQNNITDATSLANVPKNGGVARMTFRVTSFTVPKVVTPLFKSRSEAFKFGMTQGYGFKVDEVIH